MSLVCRTSTTHTGLLCLLPITHEAVVVVAAVVVVTPRSIVICTSVCVSLCVREHISGTTQWRSNGVGTGQGGQSPGCPRVQGPPSCMGVLCTCVKLLTGLHILACELHKNAFGARARWWSYCFMDVLFAHNGQEQEMRNKVC